MSAGAEAGNYAVDSMDGRHVGQSKPNIRRRFWRWLLGQDERMYTHDEVVRMVNSPRTRGEEPSRLDFNDSLSISIHAAVNGKIVRFAAIDNVRGIKSLGSADNIVYYIVPDGHSVMDAIAVALTKQRLK